ncbi:MAG: CapA family protein [Oscillospiraceae bacterium]|nr:CapA family protein [Oscillospiraceae bacterium]
MDDRSSEVTVLSVGDLILDVPEADRYFDESREILKRGDVVIGQVEIPYTLRPQWSAWDSHSAPATDPARLEAMKNAGFNVGTCAGNHSFDQGHYGVSDTLAKLRELGIAPAGEGENEEEAYAPALIERKGLKFACFSYTAVGPKTVQATPAKAGAAFIRVATSYENDTYEPGALPTHIYTSVSPAALQRMRRSFRQAKEAGALVLASFHMGRMHSTELQQYQTEIARAAVDAGAEMVFAHHPHTLLGIEMYRGKPIFYSVGHFVFATDAFLQRGTALAGQRAFRPDHFQGVNTEPLIKPREPITDTIPFYVGDEDSRNTLIAKGVFDGTGLRRASFIPCFIDGRGHPVPVRRGGKGDEVLAHVRALCEHEELDTRFCWSEDGTEVFLS